MISTTALITIIGMALVTYATRLLGYLLLRNRTLSPRTRSVLECAPGCVIISVIAPYFVSPHPEIVIAMLIAVACATRLSMLPTLIISVVSLGILKILMN
ncbi:AzlD family protein [Acinetobacter pittii]|uniref:AzlD family protein n=1 Tax=Acinetobacter pittii TaxID=48296 RepID=UPI00300BDB54